MPTIHNNNEKGFVALLNTVLVLIFMLSLAMSISVIIFNRQRISTNAITATQSYYASEAGIEDALLRLKNNPQMSPLSYPLTANNSTANVVIPAMIGGSRTISSQGNTNGLIKTIQVVYGIDSQNVSFYYGVEVGQGGLVMNNGSEILGNVFSSGNISGSGKIDNDAVVSGNGHSIQGVYVGGNGFTYSCLSPANVNNLTYITGGSHTCTVRGATTVQSNEISEQPLPIPQSQINDWKNETTGNVITGDVTVSGSQTMGPAEITGNLIFSNHATLTLTGTVYVQGNITLGNTDTIQLSSSYGTLGGVLLADGAINTGNGNTFSGSGQTGSYILFLSTNASDSAIIISNNSGGGVFYTSAGGESLSNNVSVVELTGYKVTMGNNSKIQYSNGVVNIYFSGGPGGSWKVTSWQEK